MRTMPEQLMAWSGRRRRWTIGLPVPQRLLEFSEAMEGTTFVERLNSLTTRSSRTSTGTSVEAVPTKSWPNDGFRFGRRWHRCRPTWQKSGGLRLRPAKVLFLEAK